mmetsp:Transcript_8351/g.24043  ORF Transcript_8351/g.24043 Transcript_8351/m.24043 type:complete len:259 (+) Transcript_8351:312-1088(+)
MKSTLSFFMLYFSALFSLDSNSSFGNPSNGFCGLLSFFVFFSSVPFSFLLDPLDLPSLPSRFLPRLGLSVLTTAIPKRWARNFFFSSNEVPGLAVMAAVSGAAVLAVASDGFDGFGSSLLGGASAAFLSSPAVAAASSEASFFTSTASVVATAAFSLSPSLAAVFASSPFSSAALASSPAFSGSATVGAGGGGTAIPNSSSSKRSCNRFTRTAFSPSVDKLRFSNSAFSSDTFIFFTSTSFMVEYTCVCIVYRKRRGS